MNSINVLLIDDHPHVHDAVTITLQGAPDITLQGVAFDGEEGYQFCLSNAIDVVLMDVVMPHLDGLGATKKILKAKSDTKILVLSSYQDIKHIRDLLEAGAIGYILKSSLSDQLENAIRAAYSGNTVMASEISQKLLDLTSGSTTIENNFQLTTREQEVIKHMASGLNNREVAQELFISRSTVKFHIANIIDKMQVETRAEAIVLAAKTNLI